MGPSMFGNNTTIKVPITNDKTKSGRAAINVNMISQAPTHPPKFCAVLRGPGLSQSQPTYRHASLLLPKNHRGS